MWMNIKHYAAPTRGQFILGYYENIAQDVHSIAYFEFTEIALVRYIHDKDSKSGELKLIDSKTGLDASHQLATATHWMLVPYKFAN